jgi:hypothetical protein
MAFFNTKDAGPVVLEIPPADGGPITGTIDDCWQTAIEDIGPAGVDKGGKYLIPPPDYKEKPPAGYIPSKHTTMRAMRSCAPSSKATARPTSPGPWLTASR